MISETYIVNEVGQTTFTFSFDLLDAAYLTVTVDDVAVQDWTLTGTHEVTFGNSISLLEGQIVGFSRSTPIDDPLVTFSPTSSMRAFEFQRATDQLLHHLQELDATSLDALLKTVSGTAWDAKSLPLMNLADPTNDQDAATRAYVNSQILSSGQLPPAGSGDVGKFLGVVNGPAYGLINPPSVRGRMTLDMASETSIYATQRDGQEMPVMAASFRNVPAQNAIIGSGRKVDFVPNPVTHVLFAGDAPVWDSVNQSLTLPSGALYKVRFKASARSLAENNSSFESPSAVIAQINTPTQVLDAQTVELGTLAPLPGDTIQRSGLIDIETYVDTTGGAVELYVTAAAAAGGDICVLDIPAKLYVEEQ